MTRYEQPTLDLSALITPPSNATSQPTSLNGYAVAPPASTEVLIPVLESKKMVAWPPHDGKTVYRVEYLTPGDALSRIYSTDAHFACYSLPNFPARLKPDALKRLSELPGAPAMVLAAFDVDDPVNHKLKLPARDEWRAEEEPKIQKFFALHPNAFVYLTRGGYRVIGGKLNPPIFLDERNGDSWKMLHAYFRNYLRRVTGIEADEDCDYWSCLYRAPFVRRDDQDERRPYYGNPHALGLWQPALDLEIDKPREPAKPDPVRDRCQAVADIFIPLWPSKGRRELHLALSGYLKARDVSLEDAVQIKGLVAEGQELGNAAIEEERQREAERTYSQIEEGDRTTGATRFRELLIEIAGEPAAVEALERADELLRPPPKLSRDLLKAAAAELKKTKKDYAVELALLIGRVEKGDLLKLDGSDVLDRDGVLRLAESLGRRFERYDPASIAAHFAPSLSLMQQTNPDCPTVDDVAGRITRTQDAAKTKRARQRAETKSEHAALIRDAFKGDRDHPYTKEELEGFGPMGRRWIIQRDRSYYMYLAGEYVGPYSETAAALAAERDLSPAETAGVKLTKLTKDGVVNKSIKEFCSEYGTVASAIEVDFAAQRATYDDTRHTLIEAPCPLRPIAPVYHADIDQWLRLLAVAYYDQLERWITYLEDLDRPCVAPLLSGPKSTGKSMLALGLSRGWCTTGPTDLEAAFAQFNDQMLRCPLVFGDERIPTDHMGRPRYSELRAFVQAVSRTIDRKHMPKAKAVGATRTLIAAHDPSILATGENMTELDIEATAERILFLPTQREAAEYLANLRPSTYERGWVYEDKIAEHAKWLRQNRRRDPEGRFMVPITDDTFYRALVVASGVRSSVCQWLVSYVLAPDKFHKSADSRLYARMHNGELLVNVRALMSCWDAYVGNNEKCPPIGILSRALRALSESHTRDIENDRQTVTRYRVIALSNLVAWAEITGFTTAERIAKKIGDWKSTGVNLGLVC